MFDVNYDFFLIENNFKEIEEVKSEKIQGDTSSKLPLVSIVIPTYKRVSTLRETLDSAIRQTGNHNYEILVVDNNPERGDETELLMAEYVSVKNLLYFKNTANIGMAGNWSRCSELAHGEWVVLIHDDDLLVNNYLDEIEPCLINCVDGLFVCPKTFIDGEPLPTLNNSERMEIMKITLMYQYLFPILCASGNALRKSKILEYGGYTSKTYAPDFFFSKMVCYSNVYMTNKSLIYYRKGLNESTKTEVMDKLNYINHYFRIQNFQRIGIPLYLINIIMPYSDILFEQGFKKEWNKEYQYSHMKKYKKFDVFMSGIIYRIVEMVIKVIRRVNRKIIVIE